MDIQKLKEIVDKLAAKNARCDNPQFNVCDWSGGNFDDAYSMGCDDGEVLLARQLQPLLGD